MEIQPHVNSGFLASALTINAVLGVLYGWSLFLVPLETLLASTRAEISLVPSLALVCFTIGMFFHDNLLRRIPLALLTSGALAMAGLGHLLFYWLASYASLVFGYGVLFGLGGGVGFGLALALARATTAQPRGSIVGVVAATFAISGMSISALGAALGTVEPVERTFGFLGGVFLTAAAGAAILLRGRQFPYNVRAQTVSVRGETRTSSFWLLFVGNFAMCYAGLMFISHGAALLHEQGLSIGDASWAPFSSNLGYVLGALFGGVVATRFPGRIVPLVFSVLSLLSAAAFLVPNFLVAQIAGLFFIGSAFGGTVSVFMMLFTMWFGVDKVGALFGRINIGYGLAGLLAPAVTGWLFTNMGGYTTPVMTSVALLLLGSIAIAVSPQPKISRSAA